MGKKNGIDITGVVGVPKEYFLKMAKHDYNNYRYALAREFYQNSLDAGASRVVVDSDSEKRTITIEDNGTGMDLDTLKNKLLVLGGSKKAEGSTGAFGKAKEVLFFSWERYTIRTGDLYCEGSGAEYRIFDSPFPYYDGTYCKIEIPQDEDFSYLVDAFHTVATRFESDCEIVVDGRVINSFLSKGMAVRSNKWCVLHWKEKPNDWYLRVRVNGMWMFDKYHGNEGMGQIVVELKKSSVDILTSNRDGIKKEYSDEFDDLIKEVIVERNNILRPPKKTITEIIRGTGKILVGWEKMRDKMREIAGSMDRRVEDLKNTLLEVVEDRNPLVSQRMALAVEEMQKEGSSIYDFEDRFAFIGYKPDFIVHYEEGDEKKVRRYMQTRKARIIANAWTEIIKQVLLDIEWYGSIVCGFDFKGDERAAMQKMEDGSVVFYLNPEKLLSDIDGIKNPLSNRTYLKNDLILCAIHEAAHLSQRYHDGSYVLRSEWVQAQTWKSERIYSSIITSAMKVK